VPPSGSAADRRYVAMGGGLGEGGREGGREKEEEGG